MKKIPCIGLLICLASVILNAAPLANAQSVWSAQVNVSTDTNWSTAANWTPPGVPGPTTAVFFSDNTGVGDSTINSVVDSGFGGTIASLTFPNRTLLENVLIANGVTLNINGSLQATNSAGTSGQAPISTISGPGAALVVNNASANVFAGINGSSGSGPQTLDLSGLDTFTFTGARMMAGVGNVSTTPRDAGILSLAKTNRINLTGGSPQVDVGDNSQNTGNASTLNLGQTNVIFADTLSVGMNKQGASGANVSLIRFNPVFTANPVAYFRGHDGVSPVISWALADGLGNTGGSVSPRGNIDFTGGTVDARVSSIWMAKPSPSSPGSPNAAAVLTFEAGVINVDNLTNADALLPGSGSTPTATGTLNVNSSVNGAAALIVNNNLVIAFKGGTGTSTGTLNVNGGTVQANTITAGGGNATINLNSGTLIVTNTAGTPAAPLTTLSLASTGNAALQLSVAGAVAEINSATLSEGGPVTVNIASLPVITSYPKQFPLIGYTSFPGTFNVSLGTLPSGSPSFHGFISNNATANSIDLVLTSGPMASAVFQWTGAANPNWDLTSVDWKLFGSPVTYSNTTLVLFDDTTTVTNVNLTQNLTPGDVTVSNNANAYTFAGPGALVGSGGMTKSGSSTLVVANSGTNQFSGSIVISGGTLQFGNGGSLGNIPSGDAITDNGNLVFDLSANTSLFGVVSGSGSLVQNGSGILALTAGNTYSGPTTVNSGTLLVDGAIGGGGPVTTAAGATLGGNGMITGNVNAGGPISPGDINAVGTFTASNNLTLSSSASLKFDLNAADQTEGTGINDLLQVNGNLVVNSSTLTIDIHGIPIPGSDYSVISYLGTLSGNFNPTVIGTHYTTFIDTSSPGTILVDITGGTGADLKWNSTSSGVWDTGTSNWFNLDIPHVDFFGGGDTVLFDDSIPGAQTNVTIATGEVVAPLTITNTGAFNYTISGGGTITGPASLTKDGSGTLTVNTANGFTGGTAIVNGTLVIGGGTALGPAVAATSITVSNFGTLDLNGVVVQNQHVYLSGPGVGGNGAVINGNTGGGTLQVVTLNGDTTFGGTNDWRVANQTSGHATMNTAGLPVNLTKTGPNQVLILGTDTTDPNIENVNVLQGSLAIQGSTPQPTTQLGDPNGTLTVSSNAYYEEISITLPIAKNIVLDDGGIFWSGGGNSTNTGTLTLTNNAANTAPGTGIITNNNGSTLVVQSVITGPGNLLNTGPGTTLLENFETYTGNTIINAGTLALDDLGSLTNTPHITLTSGGKLDVSARTDGTFELVAGQTLKGSGTVVGNLTEDAGATVAPGGTAPGTLSVTGGATLAGTTVMKVDGAAGTNDVINVAQTITNSGILTVTILNPPTGGQSFKLFNAAAYGGAFSQTNLPALSAGLSWNTANLGVNGTISVNGLASPTTNATITKVSLSGAKMIVQGMNNNVPNSGFHYVILTTPNLAVPLSQWTPVVTNAFNADGTFDYTNAVAPGSTNLFFDVKVVP